MGMMPWNKNKKGFKHSGSFKKGHKSYPGIEKTQFKKGEMSEKQKGENNSSWKGGLPKCEFCGKEVKDYRSKICKSCMNGETHPSWLGGISFEPYGEDFKKRIRQEIRERDNHICQECGYTEEQLGYKLDVHHIDYNKKNNDFRNLISLCRSCHRQTNFKREDWTNYFNSKLLCEKS